MFFTLVLGARTVDSLIGGSAMTLLGVISLFLRRAYARKTMRRFGHSLSEPARARIEAILPTCIALAALVFISAGLFGIIGWVVG